METKGSRISSSKSWTFYAHTLMGHLSHVGQCRGPDRDTRYVRCSRFDNHLYHTGIPISNYHGCALLLCLFELLLLGRHYAREFRSRKIPMDRKVYTRGGTHFPHCFRHILTPNRGLQFDGIALLDCLDSIWMWRRFRNRVHTGTTKHQHHYMGIRWLPGHFLCTLSHRRHGRTGIESPSTTKTRHCPVRDLIVGGYQTIGRLFGCTVLGISSSIHLLWNEQRREDKIIQHGLVCQHNIGLSRVVVCDCLLVLFPLFLITHRCQRRPCGSRQSK